MEDVLACAHAISAAQAVVFGGQPFDGKAPDAVPRQREVPRVQIHRADHFAGEAVLAGTRGGVEDDAVDFVWRYNRIVEPDGAGLLAEAPAHVAPMKVRRKDEPQEGRRSHGDREGAALHDHPRAHPPEHHGSAERGTESQSLGQRPGPASLLLAGDLHLLPEAGHLRHRAAPAAKEPSDDGVEDEGDEVESDDAHHDGHEPLQRIRLPPEHPVVPAPDVEARQAEKRYREEHDQGDEERARTVRLVAMPPAEDFLE